MNPISSSLEKTPQTPGLPDHPDHSGQEVVLLACPMCKKELRLLRQHMGVEGSCVHCQTPVKAVTDRAGNVTVENLVPTETSLPDEPAKEEEKVSKAESEFSFFDSPSENENSDLFSNKSESRSDSEVVPENQSPHFPDESQEQSINKQPLSDTTEEESSFLGKPKSDTKASSPPWEDSESDKQVPSPLAPSVSSENAPPFPENTEESSFLNVETASPDSVPDEGFPKARTPWDEDPDTTESPLGKAGFAEALFSGRSGNVDIEENKAPEQDALEKSSGNSLQQPVISKLKSTKSQSRNSPVFKILRALIAIAIIGGSGYAVVIATPPEKIEVIKAQVKEWLKPGAVLQDYIPFKIPGLSVDEAEIAAPEADAKMIAPSASGPDSKIQ